MKHGWHLVVMQQQDHHHLHHRRRRPCRVHRGRQVQFTKRLCKREYVSRNSGSLRRRSRRRSRGEEEVSSTTGRQKQGEEASSCVAAWQTAHEVEKHAHIYDSFQQEVVTAQTLSHVVRGASGDAICLSRSAATNGVTREKRRTRRRIAAVSVSAKQSSLNLRIATNERER